MNYVCDVVCRFVTLCFGDFDELVLYGLMLGLGFISVEWMFFLVAFVRKCFVGLDFMV